MIRAVQLSSLAFFLLSCGNKTFENLCDNTVPAPAACMTQCDPSPGAPNACPLGYHCEGDGFCDAQCTPTGGQCGDDYRCTDDGRCISTACQGLECQQVDCAAMGKPPTTISGTVFAPNHTLPLYGINVYVPNAPLPALTEGAVCDRCDVDLPGSPLSRSTSDEEGKFALGVIDAKGAPAGDNIPLVITSGKWRRQIVIPHVEACTDNVVDATMTALPKNRTEGDIPKIAISTGSADALECLIRKLGIEDAEIGTAGGAQRIHLYTDGGAGNGQGNSTINGTAMADSTTMWNQQSSLMPYDIVILSCEGDQHAETKSQDAMNALKGYADVGGRVFLSHWHNIWIEGATHPKAAQKPDVWTGIANWNDSGTSFSGPMDRIDEANNPKGTAFATWMLNVMGSTTRDEIVIGNGSGKNTVNSVDPAKAEQWVYWTGGQNGMGPQNFQFTTPNEGDPATRCGKVVFSDMHVSGDSHSPTKGDFPGAPGTGCATGDLTPQEKALAFMFFDLASCVGVIF